MRGKRLLDFSKNLGIASALALALSLTAPFGSAHAQTGVTGEAVVGEMVTATATVEKINLDKRLVTLKPADGEAFTVKVGEAVENLPQVEVGDTVEVDYYEAVALDISEPKAGSAPGESVTEEAVRAKKGEMPAGAEADVVTYTSEIVGIDRPQNTVTLMGPDDHIHTVKVENPEVQEMLDQLKLGEMVQISFIEAVAVAVRPEE
jgi:translation elongation factor P/translation initiation factor 5A